MVTKKRSKVKINPLLITKTSNFMQNNSFWDRVKSFENGLGKRSNYELPFINNTTNIYMNIKIEFNEIVRMYQTQN